MQEEETVRNHTQQQLMLVTRDASPSSPRRSLPTSLREARRQEQRIERPSDGRAAADTGGASQRRRWSTHTHTPDAVPRRHMTTASVGFQPASLCCRDQELCHRCDGDTAVPDVLLSADSRGLAEGSSCPFLQRRLQARSALQLI